LAPDVVVNRANFYMWAQDFGFKYRGLALNGQYFSLAEHSGGWALPFKHV
jgi:hypothetical protein